MLKQVKLTNIYNGRTSKLIVDTDEDAKAVFGAGKAPNETAEVTDITGPDEFVNRVSQKKPNLEESAQFFYGMARCLQRNISITKALELMAGRLKTPRFRGAVAAINRSILSGEKMSDAFAEHPDIFTEDVLALIRAGEESGQLDMVFQQITSGREKSLRILRKLKAGMIYPGIVLVLAVVVIIVMSYTLVPAVSKLYASMNVELPFATKVLIAFSDILIKQPYMALLPLGAVFMLFKYWGKIYSNPPIQRFFSRIPNVGKLITKTAAMVSFRILALLLQANVRVVTALEIAAKSSGHVDYEEFYLKVRDHIADGLSMPEAFLMECHRLGDDGRGIAFVVQMAGETGSMNEVLDQIASDYEEQLDLMSAQIDKLLEPFVLIVLGSVVGGIIYAIYGPIFGLSKVILPQKHGEKKPSAMASPVPGSDSSTPAPPIEFPRYSGPFPC
jgi:type IV pilus assembly protein PilC